MTYKLSYEDHFGALHEGVDAEFVLQQVKAFDAWFQPTARNSVSVWVQRGEDESEAEHLILIAHEELGFYLKFGHMTDSECVSVADVGRLTEKVTLNDGSWIGAGHFVDIAAGLLALQCFCETGTASEEIGWLDSADLPDTSFWWDV